MSTCILTFERLLFRSNNLKVEDKTLEKYFNLHLKMLMLYKLIIQYI